MLGKAPSVTEEVSANLTMSPNLFTVTRQHLPN